MLIEIRAASGERLASACDISSAVSQLVSQCERYRRIIEEHHRQSSEVAVMEPDISATAPEDIAVYSAGWRAACRAATSLLLP